MIFVFSTPWQSISTLFLSVLTSVFGLSPSSDDESGGFGVCILPSMRASQKMGLKWVLPHAVTLNLATQDHISRFGVCDAPHLLHVPRATAQNLPQVRSISHFRFFFLPRSWKVQTCERISLFPRASSQRTPLLWHVCPLSHHIVHDAGVGASADVAVH